MLFPSVMKTGGHSGRTADYNLGLHLLTFQVNLLQGQERGPAVARLWKGVRLCPSHPWALTWAVSSAVPMVLFICPAVSQSQGKTEFW